MPKILVTGANGQLGRALREEAQRRLRWTFLFTDVEELDLLDVGGVRGYIDTEKPDYVINCAAYTAVDKAEEEGELAYRINAGAVAHLLEAAREHPFRLLHLSTDYVFDGRNHRPYREEDPAAPVSVYGKSKYEGEQIALGYPHSVVVRTAWLYSEYGNNFVSTILRLARSRDELQVVYDQVGSPTYAGDLAGALLAIIDEAEQGNWHPGIYHYSNEGVCSWYDLALEVLSARGIRKKVKAVTSEAFVRPAPRPFYSVLAKEKIKTTYRLAIPHWKKSLYKCLKNLKEENMEQNDLLEQVKARARKWLEGDYDEATKQEVRELLEGDPDKLIDAFYKDLEFGTGGLRGIMGAGTNRMNIYTVGMATQGLANYLKKQFADRDTIRVVVSHDCRNNSRLFAETTAGIFAGNGFEVYLFDDLRPTPELSFAIRHLGCQSGVMITASHNPKEYNGYKAYWEDGAQVIPPHDRNIIDEVKKIQDPSEVKFNGPRERIHIIGKEVDDAYLEAVTALSLTPEAVKAHHDMKIVYTPIHGTGVKIVPEALHRYGFTNIIHVPEQDVVSGDFPTVVSPNPEEHAALEMALKKADETGAELVMASDPDGDRLGVAVRDDKGQMRLLNGNQTATLLTYYILTRWKEKGKITGNEYIVKTIVTTDLLAEIAKHFGVKCFDVLTGFKWIADVIRRYEGKMTFIAGGEESYGFMVGDFVRDKDSISTAVMVAETAAWAKQQGMTLFDLLKRIYTEFAFYKEDLLNIVKKGKKGAEEIQAMMDNFRSNYPETINGSNVMLIHDYLKQQTIDLISDLRYHITLPKSNVLQFILHDGSKVSVRPSGTEPKIKFYFSVKTELKDPADFDKVDAALTQKIEAIKKDLGLT